MLDIITFKITITTESSSKCKKVLVSFFSSLNKNIYKTSKLFTPNIVRQLLYYFSLNIKNLNRKVVVQLLIFLSIIAKN